MNHEDVQKLSNAANAKITLLQNDFLKYFMRAMMSESPSDPGVVC